MPLTPNEEQTLGSWNFLDDYRRHRKQLINLAQSIYAIACWLAGPNAQLNEDDCLDLYYIGLSQSSTWEQIFKQKWYIGPNYSDYYARLFAKYVLYKDWATIKTPCP